MQFKDAAYEILKKAKEPLHYHEITERAITSGILTTSGQTPHSTMGALLYSDTLKENSRFRRGERKGFFTMRTEQPPGIARQIASINAQVKRTLRQRLLQMDPKKFEELIQLLLDEMGLQKTSVTSYAGDGGIDVRGILNAENLSEIAVAVQAKRWKKNVGAKVVRELRGSIKVHEHGIVITPSDFTSGAVSEAEETGKVRISLIKGDQLVDLLITHHVGVASEEHTIYNIDEEFWSEIIGEENPQPGETSSPPMVSPAMPAAQFPIAIQAAHKGQTYNAELLDQDGQVRYAGQIYDSPSGAAKAVVIGWKTVNGWDFWKYISPEDEKLHKIGTIRNPV